jgi:hypothetical protein
MADPAPTGNSYSNKIFIKNISSHDLYLEFDFEHNQFGGFPHKFFCIEKQDIILTYHYFHVPFADVSSFDLDIVSPNNYFKEIRIYNMATGDLLKEIDISEEKTFVPIKYGNFELVIDDPLLAGGNP